MALKNFFSKNVPVKRSEISEPFLSLRDEMNRMFDNFLSSSFQSGYLDTFPKVDVSESENDIKISAELPGLEPKDIDISVSENLLTLRGQKGHELERKRESYYHKERTYGSFHRDIYLPSEVDANHVDAKFRNGVLHVTIPKKLESQRRATKIEIKSV